MWKTIEANSNLIQTQTDKAVLIKLPKTDWTFWHPKKCIKTVGKNRYKLLISYTNDFKFKIFRTSKKTFQKLDESELNVEEFEAYFIKKEESEEESTEE